MAVRPPLFASLLTLAGVCVLVSLGVWQVERLQWKRNILQRLAQAYETQSLSRSGYDELARAEGLTRVWVRGHYDHHREILIQPRTWKGQTGYHVITPLRLEGGGAILVNRGWIPQDSKEPSHRPETQAAGMVDVLGLLRQPAGKGLFTPENDPAKGNWYYIDISGNIANDELVSFVLYADAETGNGDLPVREALRYTPPNNHLGYALFWFSMAGVLMVIFYLRFIHGQGMKQH